MRVTEGRGCSGNIDDCSVRTHADRIPKRNLGVQCIKRVAEAEAALASRHATAPPRGGVARPAVGSRRRRAQSGDWIVSGDHPGVAASLRVSPDDDPIPSDRVPVHVLQPVFIRMLRVQVGKQGSQPIGDGISCRDSDEGRTVDAVEDLSSNRLGAVGIPRTEIERTPVVGIGQANGVETQSRSSLHQLARATSVASHPMKEQEQLIALRHVWGVCDQMRCEPSADGGIGYDGRDGLSAYGLGVAPPCRGGDRCDRQCRRTPSKGMRPPD